MATSKDNPIVTVVLPTFQRPRLLIRAIQSVLNQTFSHFRLAIYDNASGDETPALVKEIEDKDSRVVYHCQPNNIGAINNFNYGMSEVDTPYFCLLGDDNFLLPKFLDEAVRCLQVQSAKTIFVGQVENIDEQGRYLSRNLLEWPNGLVRAPEGLIYLVENGFPNWEGILFRRQVIANGQFLDASFSGAADQEFIGRIAKDYNFFVSKNVCAKFTHHGESWTSRRSLSEYIENMHRLLERWLREVSWSADQQERLRLELTRNIESALRGYVIKNVIIGNDEVTLDAAYQFVRQKRYLSYKTLMIVRIAKLVKKNSALKWIASQLAKLHLMKRRLRLPVKITVANR